MKRTCIWALAALCLALPAVGSAQGLPEFLSVAGSGVSEGFAQGMEAIAKSMDEELGLTLELDAARVEAGEEVTLRVTAQNPRASETPVTFALDMPQRLSMDGPAVWEAVLAPAQADESGALTPSVTTFERVVSPVPGAARGEAEITCEMNMGTRFYRARQALELCAADVQVSASLVGGEDGKLRPGEGFAWHIGLLNAGTADADVALTLTLPEGVTPVGDAAGLSCAGGKLSGVVHVDAAGADAQGETELKLAMRVEETALDGDADATRLVAGTLYADGKRVSLPRIQVCAPKVSAQLVADADELAVGEETILRVMMLNEGLASADVRLHCALPQGLELAQADWMTAEKALDGESDRAPKSEESEESEDAGEETDGDSADDARRAGALSAGDSGNASGPDAAPVMADAAQTIAQAIRETDGTIEISWTMAAARETEDGVAAATKVFEVPVRALQPQHDLKEKLVGAALCYSVDGGEMQMGEPVALRVYCPMFMGITREDWNGIFWASLLLLTAICCLYAAVRSDTQKETYCCE